MGLLSNINHYSIVGQGLTGLSCVRYLQSLGCEKIRIVDSREAISLHEKVVTEFPEVECVNGDLSSLRFHQDEIVIVSPGVALTECVVQNALKAGAKISSDIEIFLSKNTKPVFTVTGSNGKSTVVTLLADIFRGYGLKTLLAGNIGLPALEGLVQPYDVVVLELSSFQLERLENVPAKAAVILNVSEDHMDRYDQFTDYVSAKQTICHGAESLIINADDKACLEGVDINVIDHADFSIKDNNAAMHIKDVDGESWISYQNTPLLPVSSLKIKGRHNISNVMAAMLMARSLDIPWLSMIETVSSFSGLPHRCEWVNSINGVDFYNDSKATNVGAAVAAIEGLSCDKPMILIAGGVDKDSDFSELKDVVDHHVEKVILFGQDAEKLAQALNEESYEVVKDLATAATLAYNLVEGHGLVLLAPACASFDMFDNFEHRGNVFKSIVAGGFL